MSEELCAVKEDGRTTCCNAFTSIHVDSCDGEVEYCKACFREVANPDPVRFEWKEDL